MLELDSNDACTTFVNTLDDIGETQIDIEEEGVLEQMEASNIVSYFCYAICVMFVM